MKNNLERLHEFLAALHANDREAMGAILDPRFEVTQAESLPYGGVHKGLDGWIDLQRKRLSAWDDETAELLSIVGDPNGDEFGLYVRYQGRTKKTKKPFDMRIFEYVRFEGGRMIELRPYYEDTHLLATLDQ